MTTADIAGAKPTLSLAARELRNRPTFHEPTDIAGTSSRVLHPTLNKVSRVCSNDDIEGEERALWHGRGLFAQCCAFVVAADVRERDHDILCMCGG